MKRDPPVLWPLESVWWYMQMWGGSQRGGASRSRHQKQKAGLKWNQQNWRNRRDTNSVLFSSVSARFERYNRKLERIHDQMAQIHFLWKKYQIFLQVNSFLACSLQQRVGCIYFCSSWFVEFCKTNSWTDPESLLAGSRLISFYVVICIWHGIEFGLFVTYFTMALATIAVRKVGGYSFTQRHRISVMR